MSAPAPNFELGLKPVLFLDLSVDGAPRPVFSNNAKSLSVVVVSGGTLKSVDPAYPFDATVTFGYDDATTSSTGTTSALDCKIYATSNKTGKGIYVTYSGVVEFNDKVVSLISSPATAALSYDDAYVTMHPLFQLDNDVDDEFKWVLKTNFIGKGRFIRDSQGVLRVQYYIYVLA